MKDQKVRKSTVPVQNHAVAGLTIEMWDIDRPKDYPQNARVWTKTAIDKVAASIREFGFRQPVVVDREDVIIIGHLRRTAARTIPLKQIPVHIASDLNPLQVRQLRLMDNRSHQEADWNFELLAKELSEIKTNSPDLVLTGFDTKELDDLLGPDAGLTDPDQVPPVPISQTGDVWILDSHRVACGDATNPLDVKRVLNGEQPLLMVTDPPYGINLDSEWRDRAGLNGNFGSKIHGGAFAKFPAEPSYMKKRSEGHTETTVSGDTRADWSEAFELVPSLQVAYVWHASEFMVEVLSGLLRIGFVYPQQLIWDKGLPVISRTHYWYQHEACWYVRKPNAPWFGLAGANSTVWQVPSPKMITGKHVETKFDHPTQKPVAVLENPITNHLEPDQIVYDPFLGSGSTLIAAHARHRRCFGLEIEPRYVDVIVERWQNFTGGTAHLEQTNQNFEDTRIERLEKHG